MPKRNTRRNHTPRFKFRVALEAAKGVRSINEIAAEHKLAPSQVTAWKKARTDALDRTLGRLVVLRSS